MQQPIGIAGVRAVALQAAFYVQQADRLQNLQRGADGAVSTSGLLGNHGEAGIGARLLLVRLPPQLL